MIKKKDEEAGYIEFEQPEEVPDVKPITEKELDQKLREADIESQHIKPIRDNTISPQYSREMSRYDPPLPERKRKTVLEKVREITNGGSKGSRSEKPVEGTMRVWNHIQSLMNQNHPGTQGHQDRDKGRTYSSQVMSKV